MREILFRGKTKEGKWVYGDLVRFPEDRGDYNQPPSSTLITYIANSYVITRDLVEVLPETVGMLTPFVDQLKNKVWEGDIIEKGYGSSVPKFVVAWSSERGMWIQQDGYNEPLHEINFHFVSVIGNIHNAPETN